MYDLISAKIPERHELPIKKPFQQNITSMLLATPTVSYLSKINNPVESRPELYLQRGQSIQEWTK